MGGSLLRVRALSRLIGKFCCPHNLCSAFRVLGLLVSLVSIANPSAFAADQSSAAWRAANQLINAQLPSGRFAFEHDFVLGGQRPNTERGDGRLNYITREAGTAWALSSYFLRNKDPSVARALVAALRKFEELSLPIAKASGQETLVSTGIFALPFGRYKLRGVLNWLGLLYRPFGEGRLVAYDRSYETAWGAATAFALLTELQFYRARHDLQFAAARRAWLKGLLVLYDGNGGFRTLPDSIDEDAMSNGEIWLTLAYYTDLFPEDRATSAIVAHIDNEMLRTYAALSDTDYYSWGVKAAAQRLETTSDSRFREFIAEQTQAYFSHVGRSSSSDNSCADVEGLATALRVLSAHADRYAGLIRRLRQHINREMDKNLSLQLQPGQTRINLGNSTELSSPFVANYAGAFLAGIREPYTRIDYTAHCISALMILGE